MADVRAGNVVGIPTEVAERRMGIEYQLRFDAPDAASVAEVLRRHPTACDGDPPGVRFEFGSTGEGWSEATAVIEGGGLYFCDHCGGLGLAVLGGVIVRLASAFGPVTVEEL